MKKTISKNKSFKNEKTKVESISNLPKDKKISFFAAMMVVVGSSVGAGIFLRSASVLGNAHYSLPLAIFSWLVAAFAVIAMGLSLIEIASGSNDNLSLIGWCKTFNSKYIYKASKNFMFYIYMPLTFFFMPLYVLIQLQDGIGVFTHTILDPETGKAILSPFKFDNVGKTDWLIWTSISIVISLYFIFSAGYSSRIGNLQNLVISFVKFIPLLIAAFIGYAFIAMNPETNIGVSPDATQYDPTRFGTFNPGFGMFLSVSGIFFAYDGFYVTAGLQTEMQEPKKTPLAILLGLVIVTVIYLSIAISMSLNGTGSFWGFGAWLYEIDLGWLFFTINLLISIGILGIVNGFAMWTPRFIEDLIKENELPFSYKFKDKLNSAKPKIGIIYTLSISIPIILLFSIIGALGFEDTTGYGAVYGDTMGTLYSFADITANWTALFAFGFITFAIYGGLKNRKTKKIKVEEYKYFIPFAISSVGLISVTLFMTLITPIIDLFLIYIPGFVELSGGVEAANTSIVGRVVLVVVLILFIAIMFVPTIIEDYLAKKTPIKKIKSEKNKKESNENINKT